MEGNGWKVFSLGLGGGRILSRSGESGQGCGC